MKTLENKTSNLGHIGVVEVRGVRKVGTASPYSPFDSERCLGTVSHDGNPEISGAFQGEEGYF